MMPSTWRCTFGNVRSQLKIHRWMDSIVLGGRVEPTFPSRCGKKKIKWRKYKGGCGITVHISISLVHCQTTVSIEWWKSWHIPWKRVRTKCARKRSILWKLDQECGSVYYCRPCRCIANKTFFFFFFGWQLNRLTDNFRVCLFAL